MSNTRHVVVVRKDLDLSPGLLAAQVAHISDAFMRTRIEDGSFVSALVNVAAPVNDKDKIVAKFSKEEMEWMKQPYISVLAVNNGEELQEIVTEAKREGLVVHEWSDVIPSEILKRPIRVKVGISIGPDDFDKLKMVTGNLPLF